MGNRQEEKENIESQKGVAEFKAENVLSRHSEDKEKPIKNLEIQLKRTKGDL